LEMEDQQVLQEAMVVAVLVVKVGVVVLVMI
jgi:hypothetical protein